VRLTGLKLPLERLSATSLSTFTVCPEQFRRKYLLNEKETMSGERFMGSVTHQALQKLFQAEADPENAVMTAWQNVIDREGEPEWHDVDATDSYKRAKKMIAAYWPIASTIEPIAVEQRFEEKIAGVTVVGYVDRELKDRILEVKTASAKVAKPKSRWSFQGRLYSLVSQKPIEWNVITRQVTPKIYTPDNAPDLYVPAFNADATVYIVRQAVERMNDLYARHGKDQAWPMDGIFGDWSCGYCSFRKRCPAWN
jgi:CRISPR/Cas system-associated exonuclease Cas4 (RecB family)